MTLLFTSNGKKESGTLEIQSSIAFVEIRSVHTIAFPVKYGCVCHSVWGVVCFMRGWGCQRGKVIPARPNSRTMHPEYHRRSRAESRDDSSCC